jgi:hypothetical protein
MNRIVWAILIVTLLYGGQGFSLEITSVAPTKGTPGTPVSIGGGPFSTATQPFLGEQYVSPRQVFENRLEFTVPFLPPGNYNLTVQDERDIAAETYSFEVLAPTPQIADIDPRNLDFCSNQTQRTIYIDGQGFLPGAILLVDGKAVPSRRVDQNNLEAQLPIMQPGVYGVVARNPDGESSLPHSLWVNSIPGITNVERGDDFVNSYEVIIRGKNFFFNSTLIVKEPGDSITGDSYRQLTFAQPRNRSQFSQLSTATKTDQMVYVDCNTLVYTRHTNYNPSNEFVLEVINPDGQRTGQYYVSGP